MPCTLSFVLSFSLSCCAKVCGVVLCIFCTWHLLELYNEEVNMSLLARYFEDAYAAWIASTAGCCTRTEEEEEEKAQSSRGESSVKVKDSPDGASSAF